MFMLGISKLGKRILRGVLTLGVGASLLPTATAQFVQQGSKLVGTGAIGTSAVFQGSSVSLSEDGDVAIVGGRGDNNTLGAVWIYTRSVGMWNQQGGKLVGTGAAGNSRQGTSVAVSADGNTVIVGGPNDNRNIGAAWVYTRSGDVWRQQGPKLVANDDLTVLLGNSLQGTSVGLSADGNTAIVGAPGDNLSIGAAWVYTRSGNAWSKQAKLVDQGVAGIKDQGRSVALSADGNTAIVGGPGDLARSIGAASVYARSGGVWSQQGSKLVGTGAVGNSAQGFCVALSADGNTAAAGGYIDNNFVGAVWLYTRSDGVWSQQGGKLVGTSVVGDSQQCNVALNADGSKVIVGGGGDNNGVGAMWVYTRSVGMWNQQGGKLIGTGGEGRTAIFEGVKRIV